MTRLPRRNRLKRDIQSHKIDDDLSELAEVLDDLRLENNSTGWFHCRWRDGWNAIELALNAWSLISSDFITSDAENNAVKFLLDIIKNRKTTADTYLDCSFHIDQFSVKWQVNSLLYAAIRCLQIYLSNSDGGGEVYNDLLKRSFSSIVITEKLEKLVLEYRCRDSIGTTSVLQGDKYDRVRRAFVISWLRGLYLASYALPHVFRDMK